MKILDIKKSNRPIEKMISNGIDSMSNEELLAIIIGTGTKGKSSIDISYEIINSVNNLSDLLSLSIQELMKFQGIKESKACRIESAIELTKRLMVSGYENQVFLNHTQSFNYLFPLLRAYQNEHLIILYLNSKCRLIKKEDVSGGINFVNIIYNEIIKHCIKYGSRGVIISHNHPSGDSTPSHDDIIGTEELSKRLEQMDLILFDHLIIGHQNYYSFSENLKFNIKTYKNE